MESCQTTLCPNIETLLPCGLTFQMSHRRVSLWHAWPQRDFVLHNEITADVQSTPNKPLKGRVSVINVLKSDVLTESCQTDEGRDNVCFSNKTNQRNDPHDGRTHALATSTGTNVLLSEAAKHFQKTTALMFTAIKSVQECCDLGLCCMQMHC